MGKKQKSLKLNMVLNVIKGAMSVIFPLITFPYISRVLGADGVGKYNFAASIISYFVLIAGLGINTYAIREGAYVRDDSSKLKELADELLSINIISTVAAYILLFVLMALWSKLDAYKAVLIILSLQLIFKTIGIEWIYSIYEDYLYITLRSIAFQFLSLVLMFLLVRTKEDVDKYALITVISSVGSNLLNYFHAKKYCKVEFTTRIDWKKHLKPIMVLFVMAATVTVYASSGTTILGIMCDDATVGIYAVASKVYSLVKMILSSAIVVSIPRLSALYGQNEQEEFNEVSSDVYKTLLTAVLPAVIGIIALREEIIWILAGNEFAAASSSLLYLAFSMYFCLSAYFWGQAILIPVKRENYVFIVTIISAVVNVIINIILIPYLKADAAAIATAAAELIAFIACLIVGNKYTKVSNLGKSYSKILIGCIPIILISIAIKSFVPNKILVTILTVIFSVVSYTIVEILLKNEAIMPIIEKAKKMI